MPGVFDGEKTTAPYDYHMPQIFTLPQVMVKTLPDNKLVPMTNPFFQYKFADTDLTEKEWEASGINVMTFFAAKQIPSHAYTDRNTQCEKGDPASWWL